MNEAINRLQEEIVGKKKDLARLRQETPNEPVEDYLLRGPDGDLRLSDLFGEKDDLLVVHNMGRGCAWCTMWADGYNGLLPHLESRASFVVSSPDEPAVQTEFARSRGWRFRMVSLQDSPFARDMGFQSAQGWLPGVSAFHRLPDGSIERVSSTPFGPGDDFCATWPFFDLLEGGPGGWAPRLEYGS